jgi:multicomponent Na+:H+ antiporter subunit F
VNVLLPALLLFLFANLAAGLWRVHRGPTAADRMLSALLIGSTSVAAVLVLAEWQRLDALRVAALLIVMLAATISIAYAAIAQGSAPGSDARATSVGLDDAAAER